MDFYIWQPCDLYQCLTVHVIYTSFCQSILKQAAPGSEQYVSLIVEKNSGKARGQNPNIPKKKTLRVQRMTERLLSL